MKSTRRLNSTMILTFLVLVLFTLAILILVGLNRDADPQLFTDMTARLAGPLSYDDPGLLQYINKHYIHPPSTQPYHLAQHFPKYKDNQLYYSFNTEGGHIFYSAVIRQLFHGVQGGFFVEAGAMDGEFLSTTLYLERKAGWTGLLVEPNGEIFEELLKKHRRAWSSHICLATKPFPHQEVLIRYRWSDKNKDAFKDGFAKAHSLLADVSKGSPVDGSSGGYQSYESVQCLPLASMLLALNVTHVNLVSLDVEGSEMGVLNNFPWTRVTVDVWFVEHALPAKTHLIPHDEDTKGKVIDTASKTSHNDKTTQDQKFIDFFVKRGYELYQIQAINNIGNYVFILTDSVVYKKLKTS